MHFTNQPLYLHPYHVQNDLNTATAIAKLTDKSL